MTKEEALQDYFLKNPVQKEILELHRDGNCRKDKADARGCSEHTITNHITDILKILDNAPNMDEAVKRAIMYKIIDPVPVLPYIYNEEWSRALKIHHKKYLKSIDQWDESIEAEE